MKQTREQIAQTLAVCQSERDATAIALSASLAGKLVSIGRASNYTLRLAQPFGAHGGIAVVTFAPSGQKPSTVAAYFEGWKQTVDDMATHCPSDESIALRSLAEKGAQYGRDVRRLVESGRAVIVDSDTVKPVSRVPNEVNA